MWHALRALEAHGARAQVELQKALPVLLDVQQAYGEYRLVAHHRVVHAHSSVLLERGGPQWVLVHRPRRAPIPARQERIRVRWGPLRQPLDVLHAPRAHLQRILGSQYALYAQRMGCTRQSKEQRNVLNVVLGQQRL